MFYSIGSQIAEQLKCQTVPIVVPNSSFSIKLLFLLPSILIWKNCDRKSIDEKIIVRKSLFSSLIILAITGRFPDSHLHRRGREIWIFNSRHFFLVLFLFCFYFLMNFDFATSDENEEKEGRDRRWLGHPHILFFWLGTFGSTQDFFIRN